MIENIDPEMIAAAVPFLLGVLDGLRRYYQNEDIPLYTLPWVELKALLKYFRRRFATKTKPADVGYVERGITVDELRRVLGKQGVQPDHIFSWYYEGEVFNGYAYFYDPDEKNPHRTIHVRAFPHVDGLEILAHEEASWYHHPIEHLRNSDIENEPAMDWVKEVIRTEAHVEFPTE